MELRNSWECKELRMGERSGKLKPSHMTGIKKPQVIERVQACPSSPQALQRMGGAEQPPLHNKPLEQPKLPLSKSQATEGRRKEPPEKISSIQALQRMGGQKHMLSKTLAPDGGLSKRLTTDKEPSRNHKRHRLYIFLQLTETTLARTPCKTRLGCTSQAPEPHCGGAARPRHLEYNLWGERRNPPNLVLVGPEPGHPPHQL